MMNYLSTGTIIVRRNMSLRERTGPRRCPRTRSGAIIVTQRPWLRLRYLIQVVALGNEICDCMRPVLLVDRRSGVIIRFIREIVFNHLCENG